MSQLGEVRYASPDTAGSGIELLDATQLMQRRACSVVGPQFAELQAIILALPMEYGPQLRRSSVAWLLESWVEVSPAGAALGRHLFNIGRLRRLAESGATAGIAIDELEAALWPARSLQPRSPR